MTELIIATKNKGKLKEIVELLKDVDIKVTSLSDYPNAPEIIEDGNTFVQNAIKKAVTIAMYTNKLVLGEDSGIEVKAIGNKPGIYSARFSGENATDEKNNIKLLKSLNGVPLAKRQARYRCAVAVVDPHRIVSVLDSRCSGVIGFSPKGKNGFGYDPLFIIPRYNKTFGELDPLVKSKISHRARALKRVKEVLRKYVT